VSENPARLGGVLYFVAPRAGNGPFRGIALLFRLEESAPDLVDGRAWVMSHAPVLGFRRDSFGGRNVGTRNDEVVIDAAKGDRRHRFSSVCSATRASLFIATRQKDGSGERGPVACSGIENLKAHCA
jgi:hypothetical protein